MSSPACDHCEGPPVVWQRYAGAHLCERHFRESVERRIRKELARQGEFPPGARIAVAYSGGKDSTVALHAMAEVAAARPDVELVALTIDEGIEGYRPPALALTADVCRSLGVEQKVRRTRDVAGLDTDDLHRLDADLGECSFCGVFRRRIMNDLARDVGAARLVTGHNLDDVAQSILMNLATANLEKLAKLAPHAEPKQGLVPRLLPLRTLPESEVYLYAMTCGLRWHEAECPYASGALRQAYREALWRLEEARPGTRHALLRTHEVLRPLVAASTATLPMAECVVCGGPTSGTRCKPCEFRERFVPHLA